jgi:hypothetical protein
MNGLQGMTTALGAASPYAQQLAENNARQAQLDQMIRSGLFAPAGGYGASVGGYAPPAANLTPQPYPTSAPTPFTGFADILNPKRPTTPDPRAPTTGNYNLAPQPHVSPKTGPETGEGSYGMEPGTPGSYEGGYATFKEWLDNMKGLPAFVEQFTIPGIANQIYQKEFTTQPTTVWDAISTGGPISGMSPPGSMVEILSRSPYALGETYPIPEVEQGILAEPSPIPIDEVYQQWLADQVNAGQEQKVSGPNWWDDPQPEEDY